MKLVIDTRPRYGHNFAPGISDPLWTKITYMAHAKTYVMARRPGCTPFVITERQWLAFPLYDGQPDSCRAALEQSGEK